VRLPFLFNYVGFEVSTAVITKDAVFWDVAQCRFILNRRFGVTCRLHLQCSRINAGEVKCQTAAKRLASCCLMPCRNKDGIQHALRLSAHILPASYTGDDCAGTSGLQAQSLSFLCDFNQHSSMSPESRNNSKAIPATGRGGLQAREASRLPLPRQSDHRWRSGCQPYALYSPETLIFCFCYSFVRG
jgi:hypothetical protein